MPDNTCGEEESRNTEIIDDDSENSAPSDDRADTSSTGFEWLDPSESGDNCEDGPTRIWDEFTPDGASTTPGNERPNSNNPVRDDSGKSAETKAESSSVTETDPGSEESRYERETSSSNSDPCLSDAVSPSVKRQSITDLQPRYRSRKWEFYVLWLAAVLTYGFGDMVTTHFVFVTPRITESNPVIGLLLQQFGVSGFVAAKLLIFSGLLFVSVKGAINDDQLSYYAPPALAVVLGTILTLWNLSIIFGV
jgi:hypothetical protein